MSPGDLTQRVSVERRTTAPDELGQPVDTWIALATLWAAVEPVAGREFIAGGALQSQLTTKIRIRYLAGLTTADRVIHGGRQYNILSVIDYRSARREIVLMCNG